MVYIEWNDLKKWQFTPQTLIATIKSYTKNVNASGDLFYRYANSQTFVFMQLIYLNLKVLNNNGGKLNPFYENFIKTLPVGERNLLRVAILHNYSFYWAVRAFGQTAFSGEDVLDSSVSQEICPKLAKL